MGSGRGEGICEVSRMSRWSRGGLVGLVPVIVVLGKCESDLVVDG